MTEYVIYIAVLHSQCNRKLIVSLHNGCMGGLGGIGDQETAMYAHVDNNGSNGKKLCNIKHFAGNNSNGVRLALCLCCFIVREVKYCSVQIRDPFLCFCGAGRKAGR